MRDFPASPWRRGGGGGGLNAPQPATPLLPVEPLRSQFWDDGVEVFPAASAVLPNSVREGPGSHDRPAEPEAGQGVPPLQPDQREARPGDRQEDQRHGRGWQQVCETDRGDGHLWEPGAHQGSREQEVHLHEQEGEARGQAERQEQRLHLHGDRAGEQLHGLPQCPPRGLVHGLHPQGPAPQGLPEPAEPAGGALHQAPVPWPPALPQHRRAPEAV